MSLVLLVRDVWCFTVDSWAEAWTEPEMFPSDDEQVGGIRLQTFQLYFCFPACWMCWQSSGRLVSELGIRKTNFSPQWWFCYHTLYLSSVTIDSRFWWTIRIVNQLLMSKCIYVLDACKRYSKAQSRSMRESCFENKKQLQIKVRLG